MVDVFYLFNNYNKYTDCQTNHCSEKMAVGSSSWPFTLVLPFCEEKDGVVLVYPFPLLLPVGEEDRGVVLLVLHITVLLFGEEDSGAAPVYPSPYS